MIEGGRLGIMAPAPANLWVLLGLGLAVILYAAQLKRTIKEDLGAFVERLQLLPPPQPAPPKAPHPLTGLTFAVSDLFDIDGHVTGFGHPDWKNTHDAASRTSLVVSTLVEGGATCVGKTVVDEMAFSMSGENKHYGTPTNPAAPSRVPGGCSSGAAVAVAANLVDFSLGIDTIGGVRVPAAFCGIIGFRSSHGIVPHTGYLPVSPSLDTVGWFAKDPSILRRVGHVLLQLPFAVQCNPRQIIIAHNCFQEAKFPAERVVEVVIKSTEKLFGKQVLKHENIDDYFSSKVPSLKAFRSRKGNGPETPSIQLLAEAMQFLHRHEFKQNHEEWINTFKPVLDPSITAQLNEVSETTDTELENCKSIRSELRFAMNSLLKDDGILVIPTADPPPKLGSKEMLSEDFQSRASGLLSIASISGCCQVTVPMGVYDECPISVSIIARYSGDRFLLDTVQIMYASLQEHANVAIKSKSTTNSISQEQSAKEKGNQAFKDKQWRKVIGFYSEAIKLNGNNAAYYSNRAAAYLEIGSLLQAEADSGRAIELDKKNVKAYLCRATAREMLGSYNKAIEDFRYALVLEPTNRRASLSVERLKKLF